MHPESLSKVVLPAQGSGRALEGANDLAGYPATIKVTLLGLNHFFTNCAAIDLAGV